MSMFTQPCFIRKNTPKLRDNLKKLGYKCNNGKWMGTYLATFKRDNDHDLFYCGTPEYDLQNSPSLNYSIDCGTNDQLFIAIAALRDDTDENQWFVMDVDVYLNISRGDWFKGTDINGGYHVGTQIEPFYCHKATVEELIEHFKNKY